MDWIGAVKFALGELGRLATGKVAISGQSFAISGEAQTADAYAALLDANSKTLPASMTLGQNDIEPPRVSPYTFAAARRGLGVVLSGYVPDAAARDAIRNAARAAFGDGNVSDTLVFANGAPDDFQDAVKAALEVVGRLAGGHVVLSDNDLVASGYVYQPAAVDEISDRLSSTLPQGFSADTTGIETRQTDQPLAANDCHDTLEAVLKTGRIAFSNGQTDIAPDSFGLLDRVSAVVARCPDADLDIAAYSNSQGSASKNRDRTQARADSIVDFLVSAGIKRERLSGVGYGEDHPIADNNTAEGRAQNERIEFSLAVPQADAGDSMTGGG
jgi:OOP family OmpA-OmpF porin